MNDNDLEDMHYYFVLDDIVSYVQEFGYSKVLKDIVTLLAARNDAKGIDSKEKQEYHKCCL